MFEAGTGGVPVCREDVTFADMMVEGMADVVVVCAILREALMALVAGVPGEGGGS